MPAMLVNRIHDKHRGHGPLLQSSGGLRHLPPSRVPEHGENFAIHLDRPVAQGRRAVIHSFVHASSTPAVENRATGDGRSRP